MSSDQEQQCCDEFDQTSDELCAGCGADLSFTVGGASVSLEELRDHLKMMMRKTIVPTYYLGEWEEFAMDLALMKVNSRLDPEEGHPLYQIYLWFVTIIKDDKVMIG